MPESSEKRNDNPNAERDDGRDERGRWKKGHPGNPEGLFTSETAPRNGGRPKGPSITKRRARVLQDPVTRWPHFVKLARELAVPEEMIENMIVADLMAVSDVSHAVGGQAQFDRDVIDRLEGPVKTKVEIENVPKLYEKGFDPDAEQDAALSDNDSEADSDGDE